LNPEQISGRDDLWDAHAMLGACLLEQQQLDDAKKQFEIALQIDPDRQPDPLFYSSTAIRNFDDVRGELDARARADAEDRARRQAAESLRQKLANLRLYEHHPATLSYVPFGIGKFNNDAYAKGGLFAAGEVLTLGTSFGIWFYLVDKYGLRSSNVAIGDAQTVRTLQGIEIGTGAAFVGLAIWGVIDARVHYKPDVLVPGSEQLLKDLEQPAAPPKPPKTTLRFVPIAVPDGAGVGLTWETP
jgi:tetratricopeptide (TPR) repeat protein